MGSPRSDISFDKVGGLDKIIETLKDHILLPLQFHEIPEKYHLKKSRGLLFHGPPGTGKTLVAEALANECSTWGKKFNFFSQKGSDILSKYFGDSEKNIKNLFDLAYKSKPSIIFFDELDGLAPPRSERADHSHTSVVTTLLAYMDGLGQSGDVFVIGATNRLDRIDPALRRPGRFDKELFFPLPACKARAEILQIHTARWPCKPCVDLVCYIARETSGYCGADLQALCSTAVMHCLKKTHPNIYTDTRVRVNADKLKVSRDDFVHAIANIVPASKRSGMTPTMKLVPFIEPLCQLIVDEIVDKLREIYSQEAIDCPSSLACCRDVVSCPRLMLAGTAKQGLTAHIGPALLHFFEHLPVFTLDEGRLFRDERSVEAAMLDLLSIASQNLPAVLYLPDVTVWWEHIDARARMTFISQLNRLFENKPLVILATTVVQHHTQIPQELQDVFTKEQGRIAYVRNPNRTERGQFFFPLFNLSSAVVLPAVPTIDLSNCEDETPPIPQSSLKTAEKKGQQPVLRKSTRIAIRRNLERTSRPDYPRLKRETPQTSRPTREEPRSKRSRQEGERSAVPAVQEVTTHHVSKRDGKLLGCLHERLIDATDEWEIRPLEILYEALKLCFTNWRKHNKMEILLEEIEIYVSGVEDGHNIDYFEETEQKYSQTMEFMFNQSTKMNSKVKKEPET